MVRRLPFFPFFCGPTATFSPMKSEVDLDIFSTLFSGGPIFLAKNLPRLLHSPLFETENVGHFFPPSLLPFWQRGCCERARLFLSPPSLPFRCPSHLFNVPLPLAANSLCSDAFQNLQASHIFFFFPPFPTSRFPSLTVSGVKHRNKSFFSSRG